MFEAAIPVKQTVRNTLDLATKPTCQQEPLSARSCKHATKAEGVQKRDGSGSIAQVSSILEAHYLARPFWRDRLFRKVSYLFHLALRMTTSDSVFRSIPSSLHSE